MHRPTSLPHPRTRPPIPRALRLAAGLAALLLAHLPVAASAAPQTEGRWTNPSDPGAYWDHIQVHMALLPGDATWHSYVLAFQKEDEAGFLGGLWGWNPQSPDSGCQSYPTSSLVRIAPALEPAGADFFCAGLANVLTPNGPRLLIAGGHDPLGGEPSANGIKDARLFDPTTRDWTMTSDMAYRRYYPTLTKLGSKYGAVALNGWQFHHMVNFGGRAEPDSSSSATDNIERLAIMESSEWDAPKLNPGGGTPWPAQRAFHTAVVTRESIRYFQGMVVYGGIDDQGEVRRDGWRLSRSGLNDHDEKYDWEQIDDGNWPRLTYHGAISPNVDTMYVFGGTDQAGAAQSAVHRMYKDGSVWRSQSVITSGDSPGARYEHAVAYDEAHGRSRLIAFGGRDDTDELADNDVYALDLRTMAWKKLALGPNSDTPPAARAGHVLLSDDLGKYKRLSVSPELNWTRLVLFGGETGASEYSDEAWMLWMSPTSPDTVEWIEVDPDTSNGKPAGRAHHAAVWQLGHDKAQDRMVVFGGDMGGEDAASDTWVLHVEWPDDGNLSNFDPEWVPQPTSGASLSGHTAIRDFLETQALYPEVFDADSKTWSTVDAPRRFNYTYPHMFLLPSGNLFQAGQWTVADLLKLDENPPAWEDSSWASALLAQSSVMYEPGKVMKCGIAGSGSDTEVIAFDDQDNCTTSTGHWVGLANSDFEDRFELNLTILPDGRVIATGGYESDATTGPQIWDPEGGSAGSWTEYGELALEPAERGYHSSALLLPSGQVLSGGDDLNVPGRTQQNKRRATVYCPPNLFDSNGNPAARPEIDCGSGHLEMTYGDTVSVTVADPDDVDRVTLVRAGAVTHAFNQDQRFIELAIVDTIGTQLLVEAPPDSNRAPPGYWLLFLVDPNSTPSIASWVRLEGTPLGDPCDTVEPEEIDDLTVELISDDRLYFTWNASADDDDVAISGPGTKFGFRYWADPINNESAWGQATPAPIQDSPGVYDTYHDDVVDSLQSCTTYYLAMREVDDNANLSALHSQVSGKTLCTGGGGGDPNSSLGEVVNAATGEIVSTTRGETRRAGISTQSGGGGGLAAALVVEAESLGDGTWRFTLQAPAEFEDANASRMLRQAKDASGAGRPSLVSS